MAEEQGSCNQIAGGENPPQVERFTGTGFARGTPVGRLRMTVTRNGKKLDTQEVFVSPEGHFADQAHGGAAQ